MSDPQKREIYDQVNHQLHCFFDHKGLIVLNRVARKQFNKEEVEGEEVSLTNMIIRIMMMITDQRHILAAIMTTDLNSQEVSVPRWTSST